MNTDLSRRHALKGISLSTGSVLLPSLLGRIHAETVGAPPPKRFVFVLQCNGFQPWAAMPKGMEWNPKSGPEKLIDLPLADRDFSEDLSPLDAHKSRVTILQRLQGKHCTPFHSGGYAALAGSPKSERRPLAQTIDAALAREFPGVFPMVGLGLSPADHNDTSTVYICSAWGENQPIATQCNPDLAYRQLFGSVAANGKADFDSRASLLDFMKDDVRRVRTRLAGDELDKFDKYLHAFETMGARQRRLAEMADEIRPHLPEHGDKYTSTDGKHRLEMQFELAAAALISGLTNVVTICSGLCSPNGSLRGFGVDISIHQVGHKESQGETGYRELYTSIRKQHMELISGLVDNLETVPEGASGGSMMDNTLITYTSDSAETHHSSGKEWPFVLIGDLGKRLRPGRYLEYPAFGDPGNRSINALYCTLLHAAGKPRDHFNLIASTKEADRQGPLEDLLL